MTFLTKSQSFSVGAVMGRCPEVDRDFRAVMCLRLGEGEDIDLAVRAALDANPEVEIVSDPAGITHEAVPYETLILTGRATAADSLIQTLPRYFGPLAYRRLDFSIRPMAATEAGSHSLLFGDLIDIGTGAERGSVLIGDRKAGPTTQPFWPDGPSGRPYRWHAGQRRAVIALTGDASADGLPRAVWPTATGAGTPLAVVIVPDRDTPMAELRPLHPAGPRDTGLKPMLGKPVCRLGMTAREDFEYFEADFGADGPTVLVAPDSAFGRFLSGPRAGVDMLEIRGVFVPGPGRRSPAAAAAIRFDSERRLLAHGLRTEASRLLLLGQNEVLLQRRQHAESEVIGRDRNVSYLGLRLARAQQLDPAAPRGWWALSADDSRRPLGWLPLRLGPQGSEESLRLGESALRYSRQRWIDRQEAGPEAASLFADWLDDAVELVVHAPGGGTLRQGLAQYISGVPSPQRRMLDGSLGYSAGGIDLIHGGGGRERVQAGKSFRLGALWVRLVTAEGGTK